MKRLLLCVLLAFVMAAVFNSVVHLLGINLHAAVFFFAGVAIWLLITVTLDPFKDLL